MSRRRAARAHGGNGGNVLWHGEKQRWCRDQLIVLEGFAATELKPLLVQRCACTRVLNVFSSSFVAFSLFLCARRCLNARIAARELCARCFAALFFFQKTHLGFLRVRAANFWER